jgi:hypothetical protein
MVDRILVCVPSYGQNDARFTATAFLLGKFPGTDFVQTRRSMPDIGRNKMAEQGLRGKYDWIFFVDDDMLFETGHPAQSLDRLMEHLKGNSDIAVIGVRAYKRTRPFYPCVFRTRTETTYDAVEDVAKGLVDVDAIHFAWTLVRPDTFTKVPKPWFEFANLGEDRAGEDIIFSRKIKAAGLRIVCDTDQEVQHLSDPSVVDSQVYENFKRMTAPKIVIPNIPPIKVPLLHPYGRTGESGSGVKV